MKFCQDYVSPKARTSAKLMGQVCMFETQLTKKGYMVSGTNDRITRKITEDNLLEKNGD